MGNAHSATGQRRPQQKWAWEYRNGRYQPKAVAAVTTKPKLKWVKQPSDNHDWWIFNPNRKNNSNSNDEWPAIFQKKKKRGNGNGSGRRARIAGRT
jgi:hypothetical protein